MFEEPDLLTCACVFLSWNHQITLLTCTSPLNVEILTTLINNLNTIPAITKSSNSQCLHTCASLLSLHYQGKQPRRAGICWSLLCLFWGFTSFLNLRNNLQLLFSLSHFRRAISYIGIHLCFPRRNHSL